MCGNGVRVFARFLVEERGFTGPSIQIETLAGTRTAEVSDADDAGIRQVRVSMGVPVLGELPSEELTLADGTTLKGSFVSMGNPHFVIPVSKDQLSRTLVARYGPKLEQHDRFPEGANIEFVHVNDGTGCRAIVWERGCGITDACGTGACAVVAAAVHLGLLEAGRTHAVELPGGSLKIDWAGAGAPIWMTGPAEVVASGKIEVPPVVA
jgi:diaminopimelate epimerase